MYRVSVPLLVLLVSPIQAQTGDTAAMDRARKELEPRLVRLVRDEISLVDALTSLQKQTGNIIIDRRRLHRENPKLNLDLRDVPFWQALDDITSKARCGYSVYEEDGKLALVDTPQRRLNLVYVGICRLAVKRVSAIRDEDSDSHHLNVVAELTWEPRFRPLYLEVGAIEAVFAGPTRNGRPQVVKAAGPGQITIDRRAAIEFEMRLPAPPRSCPSLDSLAGEFKLIGPAQMLTFRLTDLQPGKNKRIDQVQEDVKVSFRPLAQRRERWQFEVAIANPPGAYRFDSNQFKDWLVYNEIYLEKDDGGKSAPIHLQTGQETFVGDPSFGRTTILYNFTEGLPEKSAGWNLVYRTPGRIVDLPLRFSLRNIALP